MTGVVLIKKWNEERTAYTCADSSYVAVLQEAAAVGRQGKEQTVPKNALLYRRGKNRRLVLEVTVSGTQFDRKCASVLRGARGTRTFTSPRTVVEIKNDAFSGVGLLRAAVLSAGLKELGNKAFQETGV